MSAVNGLALGASALLALASWKSSAELYLFVLFINALLVFKLRPSSALSSWAFWLAVLIQIPSSPLLENDHFRYLWEGRAFLLGQNPYAFSPADLGAEHLVSYGDKIGFAHLTSIYPPMALLLLGPFGLLPYPLGLIGLKILFAFFLKKLLTLLHTPENAPFIALAFPFLLKEYVQSVHLDLIAFTLAIYGLCFLKREKNLSYFLASWVGIGIKLINLIWIPFLLKKKNLKTSLVLFLVALSFPLVMAYCGQAGQNQGAITFSKMWIWNPGWYFIASELLNFSGPEARLSCFIFFFLSCIFFWCFNFSRKISYEKALLWPMAALLFFSPVANPWYGLWLLGLAIQQRHLIFTLYPLSLSIGYLYYDYPQLKFFLSIFTHGWFFLAIFSALRPQFFRWLKNFSGHR